MKVIGINGSARRDGNTALIIRAVFAELEAAGIETELIQLGGAPVRGCTACRSCRERKNRQCIFDDDIVNECIAKMAAADGIILGSPVYYTDITAGLKALIERAGYVSGANGGLFRHKVGAAVTAVRRGGAIHAWDSMNHFMHIAQMFLVGASYWNMVYGREIGEVNGDEEGLRNMKVLGENMVFLLQKLKA